MIALIEEQSKILISVLIHKFNITIIGAFHYMKNSSLDILLNIFLCFIDKSNGFETTQRQNCQIFSNYSFKIQTKHRNWNEWQSKQTPLYSFTCSQFFNSSLLLHLEYWTFSACYQSTSLKSPDPIHIIPLCLALTFSLISKKLCSFYSKLVKAWIIPFQRGVAIIV